LPFFLEGSNEIMARKRKRKTKKVKWGKIGAPGSAKRRAWMRRMRAARKSRNAKTG